MKSKSRLLWKSLWFNEDAMRLSVNAAKRTYKHQSVNIRVFKRIIRADRTSTTVWVIIVREKK